MVCNMESVMIPRPPPAPPLGGFQIKSGSQRSKRSNGSQGAGGAGAGFRLMEDQGDTASIYSVYKQKIDSMFESDSSSQINNCVQARIEKMFTDVEKDSKDGGSKDATPGSSKPSSEIGTHVFSIDYLGSVPLLQKVTSLAGLQHPLKELYFGYKKITKHKKPLTGRLEISQSGLKVQYQGEKGDLEQLNPFPTIAVWSAVKFVLHNDEKTSYAFLPLITDPDNIDKQSLFMNLDQSDQKYINKDSHSPLFAVVMRKIGVHKQLECHGFVCQTSEDAIVIAATLYKSLMAHMKAKDKKPKNRNGVSCMSIASSNNNDSGSNLVPVRPPRKKRSTTSSMSEDNDAQAAPADANDPNNKADKKSLKARRAPKVPPMSAEARKQQLQDMDAILPYEEPIPLPGPSRDSGEIQEIKPEKWNTYVSPQQKQIAEEIMQVISEGTNKGLKRVQSLRKRSDDGVMSKSSENSGDILTKVTIPRSGSFLNAGGLTRYKSKMSRANGQATGGSPLGFNELFNEFRLQEGLNSMDEILGVIIDSEGMSFNDLKPIYKEFLLKLAVTLTKDELYQRSKSIMRRQKKKLIRRTSSVKKKRNKLSVATTGLKKAFRKSFQVRFGAKKLKKAAKAINTLELKKKALQEAEIAQLPESSISTSSYDTRQFRPKQNSDEGGASAATSKPVVRKQSYKKRSSDMMKVPNNRMRRDRTSTSEDSDFFTLRRAKTKMPSNTSNQNRNSSSGYVSCSECSYDSDTCTCVSADKCYCSLGHKPMARNCSRSSTRCKSKDKCYCTLEKTLTPETMSWCGCDTDSCTDSNKCYCQNVGRRKGGCGGGVGGGVGVNGGGTIFEQLKQRGFIPTNEAAMMTPPHQRKLTKKHSNTKSTKSLEYMSNPSEMYYERMRPKSRSLLGTQTQIYMKEPRRSYSSDNLALDYELFTITNGSFHNVQHNRAIYARTTMSECGGRSCAGGAGLGRHNQSSVRSYSGGGAGGLSSRHSGRLSSRTLKSASVSNSGAGGTEALSVKKSAEIAALFADIKLSQTTDITHLMPPPKDFEPEPLISNGCRRSSVVSLGNYAVYGAMGHPLLKHQESKKAMIQNSLYGMGKSMASAAANAKNNSNMYSARNGLYTIQSQSDESRRSSVKRTGSRGEYFSVSELGGGGGKGRPVSSGLENSLGYLP